MNRRGFFRLLGLGSLATLIPRQQILNGVINSRLDQLTLGILPDKSLISFDLETMRRLILAQAPLYREAVKHQIPKNCRRQIEFYQYAPVLSGSDALTIVNTTVVNEFADYKNFEDGGTPVEVSKITTQFATAIALEISQMILDAKQGFTQAMGKDCAAHVVDIFEHDDGSPNLNLREVHDYTSVMEPSAPVGWLAYRFKFAVTCINA